MKSKWIVKDKFKDSTVYWNETHSQWTVDRKNATEYTRYDLAEATANEEGGYTSECRCDAMTDEPQKLESSTS